MGVKGLKTFLLTNCRTGVVYYNTVSEFVKYIERKKLLRGKNQAPLIAAIDASNFGYKYKRTFKKIQFGFYKQIVMALSCNIWPIYIFDKKIPVDKSLTLQKRKKKTGEKIISLQRTIDPIVKKSDITQQEILEKIENLLIKLQKIDTKIEPNYLNVNENEYDKNIIKCVKLEKSDVDEIMSFFDYYHIPYLVAEYEADDLIAELYKKGVIDFCQTDDMDILPKGCDTVVQIGDFGVREFNMQNILKDLELTKSQFIDMCIIFGTDYCAYQNHHERGEIYRQFKKHLSISSYFENRQATSFIDNLALLRKYFDIDINQTHLQKMVLHGKIKYDLPSYTEIISYFHNYGVHLDDTIKNKLRKTIKKINTDNYDMIDEKFNIFSEK